MIYLGREFLFRSPRLSVPAVRCLLSLSRPDAEIVFDKEDGTFQLCFAGQAQRVRAETVEVLDRARMLARKRADCPAYIVNEKGRRFLAEIQHEDL